MAIEIKGINNIIKKLNALSNIETEIIVKEVAEELKEKIRDYASGFSSTGYQYIGVYEPRLCGNSSYIDVGLKAEGSTWDLWKGLYFQNYGFYNYGWNFSGQYYIQSHKMWFNTAIIRSENEIKKKLKNKLKEQIGMCWKESA